MRESTEKVFRTKSPVPGRKASLVATTIMKVLRHASQFRRGDAAARGR